MTAITSGTSASRPARRELRFSAEDEAVEICNDTAYGLTAASCTSDVARAGQLAQSPEAGMVFPSGRGEVPAWPRRD